MNNYDDMRSFAYDAVCRFHSNYSESSNAVMRLAEMVMTLTEDIKELQRRDKESTQLLRDVLIECKDALLTETQRERDYIKVNLSRVLAEEIREATE